MAQPAQVIYLYPQSNEEPSKENQPSPSLSQEPDPVKKAEVWLRKHNIIFIKHTETHLQIILSSGPNLNFWPIGKGTLYFDGAPRKEPERGLPGLEVVLRRKGALR